MSSDQKTLEHSKEENSSDQKANDTKKSPKKRRTRSIIIWILVSLLLILTASGGAYYYLNTQETTKSQSDKENTKEIGNSELVDKVGKLVDLPKDERPAIATVTDVSMLKDEPFFNEAKNGDKVLVYRKAEKAILYRVETNEVIEIGSVSLKSPDASPSASITPQPQT